MPTCLRCGTTFNRSKRHRGKSHYRVKCCWECLSIGKTFTCLMCHKTSSVNNKFNGKYFKRFKYCVKCVPIGVEYHTKISVSGNVFVCKVCGNKYIYKKNTHNSSTKTCSSCRNRNKLRRHKIELVRYKGGKCVVCGYNKCLKALIFHHTNPSKKLFEIAPSLWRSLDKLKKEADKCMLVCNRCHVEIHEGLFNV